MKGFPQGTSKLSSRSSKNEKMRSNERGPAISAVEVTNVSSRGLWLIVDEEELFLPFAKFPWFQSAPLEAVFRVERPRPCHLRWPDLDVDLTLDSIRNPDKYPLVSRIRFQRADDADVHSTGK